MSYNLLSVGLWKQTFHSFLRDNALRMAAAVAYYAVFALAPLLIIALGVATILFGQRAAAGELQGGLAEVVGGEAAVVVESMIMARQPEEGIGATFIGLLLLIFGATGVFVQLKDAMNAIVGIRRRSSGLMGGLFKERIRAALTVLAVGLVLLGAISLSLSIQSLTDEPGEAPFLPSWALQALAHVGILLVLAVVFAWLFRFLPDGRLPWRVLWAGAFVTSLLFTAGQWAFSLYMIRGSTASSLGAVGSVIAVLLWVYYSSFIFLLGFELAKVWAARQGARITLGPRAVLSGRRRRVLTS